MLKTIKEKLEQLDPKVYYGIAPPDGNTENPLAWNYIVYKRDKTAVKTDKQGYSDYFIVGIVREEYIPEGFEIEVIKKMLEIPGMRLSSGDFKYDYARKPNTNMVVEVLTIGFVKAKKVG